MTLDLDKAQLDRLTRNIATARSKHIEVGDAFWTAWSEELYSHTTDIDTRRWYDELLQISMLALEPLSAASILAGLTWAPCWK